MNLPPDKLVQAEPRYRKQARCGWYMFWGGLSAGLILGAILLVRCFQKLGEAGIGDPSVLSAEVGKVLDVVYVPFAVAAVGLSLVIGALFRRARQKPES